MPSDSGDPNRRLTKAINTGAPPPEQEQLPCPRCDSTNTKFGYYNNYNFSQTRHFCKSCRRYWTLGGTLRDIPVGGGIRKKAKRSRTTSTQGTTVSSSTNAAATTTTTTRYNDFQLPATQVLLPLSSNQGSFGIGGESKGNGFTSLLNPQGPGFLALGVFGLGRGMWPFSMEDGAAVGVAMVGLQHESLKVEKQGLLVVGIAFLGLNLLFKLLEIGSSESHLLVHCLFHVISQGVLVNV